MAEFLGNDYLISNRTGNAIYGEIADLPIIDAHNHACVNEISKNSNYDNLWQIVGATDHYIWELLRKRGVSEDKVTGDASDRDKWLAAATVWPELAGNPSYEWVHLDLRRVLGIDELINTDTAESIWEQANRKLQEPAMRPQNLLSDMQVEVMCSTDDPIDSLEHHQALQGSDLTTTVRPTFRPDAAMNIFKPEWPDYIEKLEARVNGAFSHIRDLIAALQTCHDYFAAHGCLASDHGVEVPYGYQVEEADANTAFKKARQGEHLAVDELVNYMAYVLNEVAEMDAEKGWVFQLHLGCVRDVRDSLKDNIGADAGGDISDHLVPIVEPLAPFLNRFDGRLEIVLYCLDPHHQATLATLSRAFGNTVNLGAAWWLNDTPVGMKRQLEYIATVDLLANFAGMVSDSRKLLSYGSRHEMFRRCLADVMGQQVQEGRVPEAVATELAINLCYERPKQLFGF